MRKVLIGFMFTALAASAMSASYLAEATHNITVQPGGPRSGFNGLNFVNVEGNSFGTFASYGVIEFSASSFGAPILGPINGARLWIRTANAAFSADGDVDIFLVRDNSMNINQAVDSPVVGQPKSPLIFDAASLSAGIGSQFATEDIGDIEFRLSNGNNYYHAIELTLDASQKTFIQNEINTNGKIRLALGCKDDTTAGTFAGYTGKVRYIPSGILYDVVGNALEVNTDANRPLIVGQVLLSADYLATSKKSKRTVSVFLYDPNNLETPVETHAGLSLNEQGIYTFSTALVGDYVVKVKAQTWLANQVDFEDNNEAISPVTFTGTPQALPVADQLINGDCNDDNVITTDDYLILSNAFDTGAGDTFYDDRADLDGNDFITTDDYLILSTNFDLSGE